MGLGSKLGAGTTNLITFGFGIGSIERVLGVNIDWISEKLYSANYVNGNLTKAEKIMEFIAVNGVQCLALGTLAVGCYLVGNEVSKRINKSFNYVPSAPEQ